MVLYGYIKNDITDGSVKGVAGGGRVRTVLYMCVIVGTGVKWVASFIGERRNI